MSVLVVRKRTATHFAYFCSHTSLYTRVDLHSPKMLIIQFHTSSAWENACHIIFVQFQKKEKKVKLMRLYNFNKTIW